MTSKLRQCDVEGTLPTRLIRQAIGGVTRLLRQPVAGLPCGFVNVTFSGMSTSTACIYDTIINYLKLTGSRGPNGTYRIPLSSNASLCSHQAEFDGYDYDLYSDSGCSGYLSSVNGLLFNVIVNVNRATGGIQEVGIESTPKRIFYWNYIAHNGGVEAAKGDTLTNGETSCADRWACGGQALVDW